MSEVLVGLDIGTSSVKVLLGERDENGRVQVLGGASVPSQGVMKGVVRNLKATQEAITAAIDAAEIMSGREISSCVIGVGGAQIEGTIATGMWTIVGRGHGNDEVTREDIRKVIETTTTAINLPADKEVLHKIPRSYTIDGIKLFENPINTIGKRLDAEVFIVTSSASTVKNFMNCIEAPGYVVDQVMLKTLAATKAVMTEDEQNLGSLLIDIGGGTTDLLAFKEGTPIIATSLPFGGISITNDIAMVKGIGFDTAERIKIERGCAWEPLLEEYEEVLIPGIGGRAPTPASRNEICQIIQSRLGEILLLAKERLGSYMNNFIGNIVVTGATVEMPGVLELVSEVFGTQAVRQGIPSKLSGVFDEFTTVEYATAAGLLIVHGEMDDTEASSRRKKESRHRENKLVSGLKNLIKEFF